MMGRGINPLSLFRVEIQQSVKSVENWIVITGFSLLLTEHCELALLFIFAYSLTSLAFKQNKLVIRDEGGGVPGSQELKSGLSNSERIASPEIKKKKKGFTCNFLVSMLVLWPFF